MCKTVLFGYLSIDFGDEAADASFFSFGFVVECDLRFYFHHYRNNCKTTYDSSHFTHHNRIIGRGERMDTDH